MMTYDTTLISGFPGIGKSWLTKHTKLKVSDSDSSLFSKEQFPDNYIKYLKILIGSRDIVLISTHKSVRDKLAEEKIPFILVYPTKDQKQDYIDRYAKRASSSEFIELLTTNFDDWIEELENQKGCHHVVLQKGKFLSDIIPTLLEVPTK